MVAGNDEYLDACFRQVFQSSLHAVVAGLLTVLRQVARDEHYVGLLGKHFGYELVEQPGALLQHLALGSIIGSPRLLSLGSFFKQ